MTPFAEIRQACRAVAESPRHVRIDEKRLRRYAKSLILPAALEFDPVYHFTGAAEAVLAYVVILDTVNFGSGWFPNLRRLDTLSGYYTIATHLKRAFERHGPLTARQLRELAPEDCAALFGQEDRVPELMVLFAKALNELGAFVEEKFAASFAGLIESAGHSAAALVSTVRQMTCFEDAAAWHGQSVPFLKRAQIMAWDLHLAFNGAGYGRFDDIDQLTIFADNLVPHVLRIEGVLEYQPVLAGRIDAGEFITAGSEEEIELRACALHAAELMAAQLGTSAARLDYLLWNTGQDQRYKTLKPHRTKTIFY